MVPVTETRRVPAVPEWVPVFLMRPGGEAVHAGERLCMQGVSRQVQGVGRRGGPRHTVLRLPLP